jgi:SAM-dependent MidA family methyltransferase
MDITPPAIPLRPCDFYITAPEISQMSGELIGLWVAGVGRCLLPQAHPPDRDVISRSRNPDGRCVARPALSVPGFIQVSKRTWLETSPVLTERQKATWRAFRFRKRA